MAKVDFGTSFPRGALIGSAGLVTLAVFIGLSGGTQATDNAMRQAPEVMHRDLLFTDGAGGVVNVVDVNSGATAGVIPQGGDNFLRATVRGLMLERKREALGPSVPLRLTRWTDGRLTLTDPATKRTLELEAFGETNEASFARLLGPLPGAPEGTSTP